MTVGGPAPRVCVCVCAAAASKFVSLLGPVVSSCSGSAVCTTLPLLGIFTAAVLPTLLYYTTVLYLLLLLLLTLLLLV